VVDCGELEIISKEGTEVCEGTQNMIYILEALVSYHQYDWRMVGHVASMRMYVKAVVL
jgi:hypothetical protein